MGFKKYLRQEISDPHVFKVHKTCAMHAAKPVNVGTWKIRTPAKSTHLVPNSALYKLTWKIKTPIIDPKGSHCIWCSLVNPQLVYIEHNIIQHCSGVCSVQMCWVQLVVNVIRTCTLSTLCVLWYEAMSNINLQFVIPVLNTQVTLTMCACMCVCICLCCTDPHGDFTFIITVHFDWIWPLQCNIIYVRTPNSNN